MQREGLGDAPPRVSEDEALVARIRRGDDTAYADLCERHGPPLYGFVAARLGDAGTAEDIAIQVLAEACRNLRTYQPNRGTLRAWLYGIARRKMQGERRRRATLKSIPPSQRVSLESMEEVTADDPAGDVAARLDAERLVAELAAVLSDVEMEALTLHSVEGFSMREIGQTIGRSERAVDSLLRRAKQKARERLVRDDV